MKKTIMAAAVLVAMTACNKSIIETSPAEAGYGYINLGVTADTEMVVTKVGNYQTVDASNYNVMLVKVENNAPTNVWEATKKLSEITGPIKIAAGTYYFTAENQTAAEAAPAGEKGSVRVFGKSENITLSAGATETATVNCDPVNTMVTVDYEEGFTNTFVEPVVVVTDGTRALTMEVGHEKTNGVYYSAENEIELEGGDKVKAASLTWRLTATVAGTKKVFTNTFNSISASWNKITFEAGADGLLNVTIKADTTLDELDEVTVSIDPTTGEVVSE